MKRADGRGARVGDALAPLEIPVTRTLIVAGAVASRDYQDVHHDAELAREKGSPDIFMNILTTNGLVGRYITDHFGPSAVLRGVAIRLGAPNYPGDTMVLTGTVTALTPVPCPSPRWRSSVRTAWAATSPERSPSLCPPSPKLPSPSVPPPPTRPCIPSPTLPLPTPGRR